MVQCYVEKGTLVSVIVTLHRAMICSSQSHTMTLTTHLLAMLSIRCQSAAAKINPSLKLRNCFHGYVQKRFYTLLKEVHNSYIIVYISLHKKNRRKLTFSVDFKPFCIIHHYRSSRPWELLRLFFGERSQACWQEQYTEIY